MNRLNHFIVIGSLVTAFGAHAQNVGINTTGAVPNASAGLDVDFSNKGLLMPRVALTSRLDNTTIATPATSLWVYNTATAGTGVNAVTPGYYYWNSASWVRIALDGDAWKTNGNAGTDGGTSNFLGTTDANHLQFRTNNVNRMRIMNSTYPTVGIGTVAPVTNISGNAAVLHVHDGGASVGSQVIISTHSVSPGAIAGGLHFAATQATNERRTASIESYLTNYASGNGSGDLRFFTNNNNVYGERMRLTAQGRLGIGTTTPGQGLHISFPTGADAAVRIQNTGATGNAWDIQSTNAGHLHFNQMSAATPFNALHLNGANGFVGINNGSPTQRLSVVGNFRLDGAFMPGNNAGAANQLLMSAGAGNSPTWTNFTVGNPGSLTSIGKWYSSLSWTGNWNTGTYLTFIILDPDCTTASNVNVSITGPWNALYQGLFITNVVAENGQFRVSVLNNTGLTLTGGVPISWFGAY